MAAVDDNTDFRALTAEEWRMQEARDEDTIRAFSNASGPEFNRLNELVGKVAGGDIDQRGKADDAIDFEDIDLSDDELPDEEEPSGTAGTHDVPGLTDDGGTSNDTDDLFGGDVPSSPLVGDHGGLRSSPHPLDADGDDQIHLTLPGGESIEDLRHLNFDHDDDQPQTNQDPNIPPPAENFIDTVKQAWPGFEENAILNWNELLRPKQATWISKKPPKVPKPLIPSKLSLELGADQEKMFRIPGPASSTVYQRIREAEARGLICLEEVEPLERADLEVFTIEEDDETDSEMIGGYTLRDIATICDDWDSMIELGDTLAAQNEPKSDHRFIKGEPDEDGEFDDMFWDEPAAKRRRLEIPRGLPPIPRFTAPDFDNFEEATAKLGKRVILDMNDPYLLIDDVESERATKRRKIQHKSVRLSNGKLGREMGQRFNFSSDAAYDALKENNQNRVRATLSTIPVEHSMTAQRLSWPYYRVKLAASDPHSYHRPQFHPRKDAFHLIKFQKPTILKRKLLKGKKVSEIYQHSKDLTLNDNSTAVLFEFCEEIPTVLSNFGMGQKVVNYVRRTKGADVRPEKQELGESCILMPEDRSPFAIFGHVHPGEVVPTLHNQMFRAPIFKHNARSTDFLIGRSTTGQHGSTWYIRNIDHLYVVGQTLPSMEVPGPHSRRVTNIAKNRLKMVSYRLLRKSTHVTLHDITQHVADSNESQNRQKLKEFLRFRKDTKDWALPEGEEMMEEPGIRALVRPEEVCLLDAMQVGAHELENGGYEINDGEKDDGAAEDELQPDALASKMAPWRTTKAFIDASHGKAMLAVHGAGDPTGKGLGISFLRTSMKGGYLEQLQGPLATSADAIERQRKANGGHMYNVKNQDTLYTEAITDIWNRQRESLQDAQEHDDEDVLVQEDEDERFNAPQSQVAATPAVAEGMSQVSQSAASTLNRRKLKITREVRRSNGEVETVTEIVHDPVVIAQYMKKKRQQDFDKIDIYNAQLTGDPEHDAMVLEIARKEQERLEKNKERRKKREKQKKLQAKIAGVNVPEDEEGSPEPSTEKVTGTTRRCANCGQQGHIKTNKKYCLNPSLSIFTDPSTWTTMDFEKWLG
ncbi:histone acetyl transferase [Podospora aff. communis PSN243]|uniref:Histone acetyl transferase n=1 Tax=Podospora aff. communis PSN243 TaxID=3040156 RepID=A0AAV9GTF3_9PEZI|nr:histone acetyl transferase [Podospora aff. communis PSN243]